MAEMPRMPLHEAMQVVGDAAHVILAFLEWLESQPLFICEVMQTNDGWNDRLEPIRGGSRKLMLNYFDIDEKEWMAEKDALLAYIQKERPDGPSTD